MIVCQKKSVVRLRPGSKCRGRKEHLVVDLSTLAATTTVDGVEGKVGVVENELDLQCVAAPTKRFVPASLTG